MMARKPAPTPVGSQRTVGECLQDVAPGFLEGLAKLLDDAIGTPAPRKPPVIQHLTFADVVRYFTEAHPGDPHIQAGGLLRRRHPAGTLMFQFFLDEAYEIPLGPDRTPRGRAFVAVHLDQELLAKFGDEDIVIFT